jgi:hypothetical protein
MNPKISLTSAPVSANASTTSTATFRFIAALFPDCPGEWRDADAACQLEKYFSNCEFSNCYRTHSSNCLRAQLIR